VTENTAKAGGAAIDKILAEKKLHVTNFDDWKKIDEAEMQSGMRQKISSVDEMLALL